MNMKLHLIRRAVACSILAIAFSPAAQAQWPDRPIKVVVPSAAGGSPDTTMRIFGIELTKRLGQAIVIDNRPGAAGNIGMQAVQGSPADGYTFGYGNNATLATNEFLFSKLPYDPAKLVPVIRLTRAASLLVVNDKLPVKNVQELLAYGKQKPGSLTFASGGNGTSGHVGIELLKTMTGLSALHVPYKGAPQAINDLMAGQVQFMMDNIGSIGPHVHRGALRALAVTSKERSPLFPDVPTMEEAGVKGFEMTAWSGIVAPAGTPPEIVARLNKELNAIMRDPAIQAQLLKQGSQPIGGTPEDLSSLIASERVKWGEVVRKSGAKVD